MAALVWDKPDERMFETGVDHGVLYTKNESDEWVGEVWNGLVSVTQAPTGDEPSKQYADNIPYVTLNSLPEFGATIEAFMYPTSFEKCDGTASPVTGVYIGQQNRERFGFCYRTKLGNAEAGVDFAHKIHIVYGAQAAPTEKQHSTINESPEAATFSWEINTDPVIVPGFKPTALLTINTNELAEGQLATLEALLYGDETNEATLPTPQEIVTALGGTLEGLGGGSVMSFGDSEGDRPGTDVEDSETTW